MSLSELFDDLVRVEIVLWEAVDQRLRAEVGLPLGRVETLRAVVTTPDCRVQDVSTALRVTVGAASKLVDRLAAAGLVGRSAHPTDRRSSLVTATAAGRTAHDAATAVVEKELHVLLGELPDGFASAVGALRMRLAPRASGS
ncbi:MarR family winged helix-turn-helix transcriptional regulator [Actinomycetospora atypica]|uniref:MarR family winged helix-turn-helix transcriptional regulator n=1 Tax=Actinomycetospora atypica TaxID=1290095 RepID=A0ABV9YV22_9PSEU